MRVGLQPYFNSSSVIIFTPLVVSHVGPAHEIVQADVEVVGYYEKKKDDPAKNGGLLRDSTEVLSGL